VVPYAKHDHGHILKHFGQVAGQRLIDALAAGPATVFGLVAKHRIDCEAAQNGLLFAPHSKSSEAALRRRADYWARKGEPVEFLDAKQTASAVGSGYYPACLLDRRGGTINPLAYVRGLAEAALAAGASLFTHAKVEGIESENARWRVRTAEGAIIARSVIIGVGAYADGMWPKLARSIIPMRAHSLVSRPLSDNVRASVLPGGRSLTDTRRLYSGIRVRPDGRLQMSSDGPAFDPKGKPFLDKAIRRVRDLFPQIAELEWDEAWTGWVDMSSDFYPHIHELAPGIWTAIGLSGRGIAFATLLGRDLARRVANGGGEMLLPVGPMRTIAVRRMAAPLIGGLMKAYRLIDRAELAGYARPGTAARVERAK
jgi:glycine/D-amino acid oxidase-like deaminating enzyme